MLAMLESRVEELAAERTEEEKVKKARAQDAVDLRESLVSELFSLSKTMKSTSAMEKKVCGRAADCGAASSQITSPLLPTVDPRRGPAFEDASAREGVGALPEGAKAAAG